MFTHPHIVEFDTPPIAYNASVKMRRKVTDALRLLANALNLQHDYDDVQVAALPTMEWYLAKNDMGHTILVVHAEVLLQAKPQDVPGESRIVYLGKPVKRKK
jgi:hypothetical protein